MQKIPDWVWIAASAGLVYFVWRQLSNGAQPLPPESEQATIPDATQIPLVNPPSGDIATGPAQSTYDFIIGFEADPKTGTFSPVPYRDRDGFSIGYGHYMGTANPPPILSVDAAGAMALLQQDVQKVVDAINANVMVDLSRNQYDALADLLYNIGVGNVTPTYPTLIKKLNAGDYSGAAAEFGRWIYSGKVMLNALIRRRAAEEALFST